MAELYPPRTLPSPLIPPVTDYTALYVDVEAIPGALGRAAAARCSPNKDIVLMTSDLRQLDIAVNLIANLAAVGVHNYLLLGNKAGTCERVRGALACVWSSLMRPFQQKLSSAGTNEVRGNWLVRQIYTGRLAAMGFSPMLLDADVALFANPFTLIDEHLPQYQAYFLGDSSAGWLAVNGGTLYLRRPAPNGPVVRIWRELERRVFSLLNSSAPFPMQVG